MVQSDPLDQYASFGWARWAALILLAWALLPPLLIVAAIGAVLLGWAPETSVPDTALRTMAAWQLLPWLLVVAAYAAAGVRLVQRRGAFNFWLIGFGLAACLALANGAADQAGRLFQKWPDAAAFERLARPAMAGMLVFMADMNAAAWRRRRALKGE